MAVATNAMFYFLALLVFFSPAVVLSRHILLPAATTATLDVRASVSKAAQVLSVAAKTVQSLHQPQHHQHKKHHHLSLNLHSRDFIHKPTHKDYKSLTLARLHRDALRVQDITTRLDISLRNIPRSDLKPPADDSNMKGVASETDGSLEGPVMSGTSQGSGEYFSRIFIGQPPKPMYMVLDTGSDLTWVQCQPCTDCYQQADPVYDPSASSSYSLLSCESSQCKSLDVSACRNSSCLYQVSYGDGSFTVGDFATETVSFGENGTSVPNVAFGCGHDNEGLFIGSAGLMGLGGGSLSFPSQLSATSFSYCLVDRDSSSTSTLDFGRNGDGYSSSTITPRTVTAPLLRYTKLDTFYYVGVTGMSVGGQLLSTPSSSFSMDGSGNGGVIIDSGTAVTRLHSDVYSALRDAFKAGMTGLPSTSGFALFDTCYNFSSETSVEVPTVSFHFPEGKVLLLPAKNYVIPVDSAGTFCLAFAPTSSSTALSIIGNLQQQGTRVTFDLGNSRVGFDSNNC